MISSAQDRSGISAVRPRAARRMMVVTIAFLFSVMASRAAHAQTLSVLHGFTGTGGDGANPVSGLVRDSNGNFYGVTLNGGVDDGAIFKLSLQKNGAWKETTLHKFSGGSDGEFPLGRMVLDSEGNLYGTTGAFAARGTVFRLAPSGELTTLYEFCSVANCDDGQSPNGGLVRDAEGNLYGTTALGGNSKFCGEGCGVVFEIPSSGEKEVVLYAFCSVENCADGGFLPGGGQALPDETLILDAEGNLYGTTPLGGSGTFCEDSRGCGILFKVSAAGKETVLYNFCSQANCADGSHPVAGLIQDADGNFYGTAANGGKHIDYGVVFELDTAGKETVLYSFPGRASQQSACASPFVEGPCPSSLVRDAAGNLYGTSLHGGTFSSGSVFRVTSTGRASTLYNFNDGANGGDPEGGLIFDPAGNLYGTTQNGGKLSDCEDSGCGTVFELTP